MSHVLRLTAGVIAAFVLLTAAPRGSAPSQPTIAQFLKPGTPIELVSARKADVIAWIAYEEGKRNVFVATAPLFRPVDLADGLFWKGILKWTYSDFLAHFPRLTVM
jgi:hypothetical protein